MNKKKLLIFGAGSIGNHMAFAGSNLGYEIFITDINFNALKRMKNHVYPKRYKKWNNKINLISFENVFKLNFFFDIVIIGTPPDTHVELSNKISKKLNCKNILIEKPIFSITEKKNIIMNKKINYFCGYNHSLSESFNFFINTLKNKKFGQIEFVDIQWREGWEGILGAHFWMKDEYSSYLGNYLKGGGASQEHSHPIHLAQVLNKEFFRGKANYQNGQVIFKQNLENKYDKFSQIFLNTIDHKINISIDLFSHDVRKEVSAYSKGNKIKIIFNYQKNIDRIIILKNKIKKIKDFKKTRSLDFERELSHIGAIKNKNKAKNSYINILNALETIKIIKKHFNHCEKKQKNI